MAKSKQKVPESGVLRACLDLLAAEGIWHCRMNTGAIKTGARFFRFGTPGMADILASVFTPQQAPAVRPIFLWIEVKNPQNGKQSEFQHQFQREVEAAGHTYLLINDVSKLQEWIKAEI